jgi:hypothetical protein
MPGLGTITIVGVIALAVLIWFLLRTLSNDHLEAMIKQRAGSCKMTGRAQFVQGVEVLPVALAIDDRVFYYENADMQASIDVDNIEEIEYDDELSFGKSVTSGDVMRFRSHGQTFEFIVPKQDASKWKSCLPPKHYGEEPAGAAAQVV